VSIFQKILEYIKKNRIYIIENRKRIDIHERSIQKIWNIISREEYESMNIKREVEYICSRLHDVEKQMEIFDDEFYPKDLENVVQELRDKVFALETAIKLKQ